MLLDIRKIGTCYIDFCLNLLCTVLMSVFVLFCSLLAFELVYNKGVA